MNMPTDFATDDVRRTDDFFEPAEEAPTSVTGESGEAISADTAGESVEEMSVDVVEEPVEEASADVAEEAMEDVSTDVAEETVAELSTDMAEESVEDISSSAADEPLVGEPEDDPPSQILSTGWIIQVGAFDSLQNAQNLQSEIKAAGFDTYISNLEIGDRGVRHLLRSGGYETKIQAERQMQMINSALNLDAYLIPPEG